VAPLRQQWQLSNSGAAWLTMSAQLGFVAGAVISALVNLADLVAPRHLIVIGGLAAAACNAALAACHGFGAAWPWRFLTGAFLAFVYPPALKLMATWFRSGRGVALGIMVGALTVGSALPHLVQAVGSMGWRSVVLITSLLTAAGALWGGWAGAEGPFPFARAHFDPVEIGKVFTDRGTRLAIGGYLGHMWELIAMWSWIGVFLAEAFARVGYGASSAALTTFLVIAIGGVGCWYGGRWSDRGGREYAAAAAMAFSGGCALLIGWLPVHGRTTLALLIGVALVWGFWVVADSAQFSALVTELCDPRYAGTALTVQLGAGFTLACVTIWILPWMQSHLGWAGAFSSLAPGPLLGIAAMLRLRACRTQGPRRWHRGPSRRGKLRNSRSDRPPPANNEGRTRPGWGSRGPRPGRASSGSSGEATRGPAPIKLKGPASLHATLARPR